MAYARKWPAVACQCAPLQGRIRLLYRLPGKEFFMMKDFVWILAEAGTSLFEIILFFVFFNGFLIKKDTPGIREIFVLVTAFAVQFFVGIWFYNTQYVMLIS